MTERQSQRLKKKFLEDFAQSGNVTASAEAAGVLRNTVYSWRRDDPQFALDMDEAGDEAVDRLEQEARRRGMDSSDTLLIFLLKANRPDKYRDKPPVTIDSNAQGGVQIYLPERKVPEA